MTRSACCCTTHPAPSNPRLDRHGQRGTATAEFAIGVVVSVLIAMLLLHLVLTGFFDVLMTSLFEHGLDLVVDLLATTASWSLSDVAILARSGLSAVSGSAAGWAWDAVVGTSNAVVHTLSAVTSGAVSVGRATTSTVASTAGTVFDATAGSLRWAGGPVSSALPW